MVLLPAKYIRIDTFQTLWVSIVAAVFRKNKVKTKQYPILKFDGGEHYEVNH